MAHQNNLTSVVSDDFCIAFTDLNKKNKIQFYLFFHNSQFGLILVVSPFCGRRTFFFSYLQTVAHTDLSIPVDILIVEPWFGCSFLWNNLHSNILSLNKFWDGTAVKIRDPLGPSVFV